ncbi:hypothetical protein [Nocardia bovistercoris]|uniref:Uncharacterized protein n=1 Tax=Nocardia bovistercoris TaxID=2785916 RepID=A0A931MZN1_9NOCA|nr:hypothetical protein [Nocardia bovistercoris]MBH0776330.1 hypothetical protein [Nocardia bovistercoris]
MSDPHVADKELHVRIWLEGTPFDYVTTAVVLHNLLLDWKRKRWCAIEVVSTDRPVRGKLPRLPCERLFSGP